ncbi:hypothetical protein CC78DRAFT_568477 [Lojkania enalia]|uniref:LPXTG-domain-containing protein n=1 Tax=Lojkania enalia TaxID=147567 RepID=A0A9P4N632_9PLEO|nr:hypothetical protein CC78DRAFT_568477 [Didymosphaeria enalia]
MRALGMAKINFLVSLILLFSVLSYTLEVSPNSPCAKKCLDDPDKGDPANRDHSLTFNPDLSCFDREYKGKNSTRVGRKFADCQSCLKDTGYEDPEYGERDTGWFIFNNKATVDWCIFGRFAEESNPNVTDTYPYQKCNRACNTIHSSIDYRVKSDPAGYAFCDYEGNFTADADTCRDCLYDATGLTILGNILSTVKEACIQKPGKAFQLDVDIYNASRIQIPSDSMSSPSSSTTSAPSATVSSSGSSGSDGSGLSAGAIAGIVLGALIGVALILSAILLLLRRIRRKREGKIIEMPNENGNRPPEIHAGNSYYDPAATKNGQLYRQEQDTPRASELSNSGMIVELPAAVNQSPR